MPSLKAIRKRISSVKSTQKITRAMKMVAGARLNRAQQRILAMRPYAVHTADVLTQVVGSAYAAIEGEGDGSLAYWRAAHIEYFTGVCARLGGRFDDATPVLCQTFTVVWPREAVT